MLKEERKTDNIELEINDRAGKYVKERRLVTWEK